MASLHLPRIHTDTQRPSVVLKTAPLEVLRGEPRRRIEGGRGVGPRPCYSQKGTEGGDSVQRGDCGIKYLLW